MVTIYVGNLPAEAGEADVRELFTPHGSINKVQIIVDRFTGRSRGICFVEMEDPNEAAIAIDAINGHEFGGNELKVNEAQPRPPGGSRGTIRPPKRW